MRPFSSSPQWLCGDMPAMVQVFSDGFIIKRVYLLKDLY